MATIIQALQTPRRREILRLVWADEMAAGAIREHFPDVSFGAVSQHLRTLAQAGLVRCRRDGRHRYYRADREALGTLGGWLEAEWGSALYRLKLLAELEEARRGPRPGAPRPGAPRPSTSRPDPSSPDASSQPGDSR